MKKRLVAAKKAFVAPALRENISVTQLTLGSAISREPPNNDD